MQRIFMLSFIIFSFLNYNKVKIFCIKKKQSVYITTMHFNKAETLKNNEDRKFHVKV